MEKGIKVTRIDHKNCFFFGSHTFVTKEGIPVGINISDSLLLKDMYFTADKPVCFVWFKYVKQTDHMRPFFDFVMSPLS